MTARGTALALLLAVGCSEPGSGGGAFEPSAFGPSAFAPSAFAPSAEPVAPPSQHPLVIQFDYRFDTKGYFDAERRSLLELAAAAWSERLRDDFPTIPAGTPVVVKSVEELTGPLVELELDFPIDDLLVFVGCTDDLTATVETARTRTAVDFTHALGDDFMAELEARWQGPDFEPWTSAITFACDKQFFLDPTPETFDDVPNDETDFLSTAMHELGHALGVMTSAAYAAFISDDGSVFTGPRAGEVYGADVPLEPDGHLSSQLVIDDQRVLMDDSLSARTRVYPTRLDLALLEDIGYEIAPEFR